MKEFDVVIVGSGPGGYVCAIRCAQLGLKTALVEKYKTLGGTCLNVGCIPSKALLDSSERFHGVVHHYKDHGIKTQKPSLDFPKMIDRVKKVVGDTCDGVAYLMKKNKITVIEGFGTFEDEHTIAVGDEKLKAKNIVIATGSKPSTLPNIQINKDRIITSTEALYLPDQPKSMVIVGGGVIGLELGSVYARIGTEVTVVEYLDQCIPSMDKEIGKQLKKSMEGLGVKFLMKHAVQSVEQKGKTINCSIKNLKDDSDVEIKADYCLMCVGRRPYTEGLGLDKAGVEVTDRGFVMVNDQCQTNKPQIYAIGDVIGGAMLAHKAEDEGVMVAELITGQKPHIDYNLIPGVVYTWPEAAAVGQTEQELKEAGIKFKKGSFPFKASGRARASNESEGFIKVLADETTDEILGVHMLGPRCADLIGQAVIAMEYKASAEDIARTCSAHPTYSEAFKEACLAATEDRAMHI